MTTTLTASPAETIEQAVLTVVGRGTAASSDDLHDQVRDELGDATVQHAAIQAAVLRLLQRGELSL